LSGAKILNSHISASVLGIIHTCFTILPSLPFISYWRKEGNAGAELSPVCVATEGSELALVESVAATEAVAVALSVSREETEVTPVGSAEAVAVAPASDETELAPAGSVGSAGSADAVSVAVVVAVAGPGKNGVISEMIGPILSLVAVSRIIDINVCFF
jgi:hypothetical protein